MNRFNTCIFILALACISITAAPDTTSQFQNPPDTSKVHTWWHWISGNVTKAGITKDLESMKEQGVVQATILNIGGFVSARLDMPNIKFDSPEWYDMFQFALAEADRLDMTIGVHNCDGWHTSGGPWVTPELAIKQYTWSKTTVVGGQPRSMALPLPPTVNDFYRDVAVVAYPLPMDPSAYVQGVPIVRHNQQDLRTQLHDGNPLSETKLTTGDTITISFDSDLTVDRLALLPHIAFSWEDMTRFVGTFVLSSSKDGKTFSTIADLEFTGVNELLLARFPETSARYFKLEYTANIPDYSVAEIELLNGVEIPAYSPGLSGFLEKAASVKILQNERLAYTAASGQKGIAESNVIDLTHLVQPDGQLNWDAPKGRWIITRFGYTITGAKNAPATPEGLGLEIDKMDARATQAHFAAFPQRLVEAAGPFKGNTFKFLLIDSWECRFQTWTRNFPAEFEKRRGYSLIPWIPVLSGELVGNVERSEAFMHDYRETIADLIDINYYKEMADLCHKNGLELHAEVIYSGANYPPLDVLKSNAHVDLPMHEFWAQPNKNQLPEYIPKYRPSPNFPTQAALACNKSVIGSEAYSGSAHYSEAPSDLKGFGDEAFCNGINQIILHSYVHQPFEKQPGLTLGRFASHFNRNNPWWNYAQDWMTYQARVQYLLQQGKTAVDIIYYVGDQFPQRFDQTIIYDLPFGYKANACHFDLLNNKASVIDGKLSLGGPQQYALLALPKTDSMKYETLQIIAELVQNGATVYGPRPTRMLGITDLNDNTAAFNQLVDELWGTSDDNRYGKGRMLSNQSMGDALYTIQLTPDLATANPAPNRVMFIHKRTPDAEIYYVFNQLDTVQHAELLFRQTDKTLEIWNPENGSMHQPALFAIENNQMRIPVTFKPGESLFFIFKNGDPLPHISQVSVDGTLVFPLKNPSDSQGRIPIANQTEDGIAFQSKTGGDYTFTLNTGKQIQLQLDKPDVIDLGAGKTAVEFDPIYDETIPPIVMSPLKPLTEFDEPAIKYFAGNVTYTLKFAAPQNASSSKSIVLDLGKIDATAEVVLNGQPLAHVWNIGTRIPVTQLLKQNNVLEVTVATVCRNRLIGDLIEHGKVQSIWTTSPVETILNKDMPLKPSGLIGPVTLTCYPE